MSSPSEDQRRYEDAALRESRYNTLGFISGGVPMSLGHKAYLEDKEREAARQQAASAPRAQKVLFKFSDEDVPRLTASKATFDDLAPKWAWILNGKGGVEPVPIIEDSGTTENFISPAQVEQFGFGTRSTTPRLFTQVSGDGFVVRELVDVIWYSNNVQETTHFYVAPPEIPYGMVVGRDFIQEHPGALMDQKPAEAMMLTVQAKAKKNESDAIHGARERMRSQAEEIRRRRQKTHVDDAQPSTASSSRQSTLADVKSWTAHAGEKK